MNNTITIRGMILLLVLLNLSCQNKKTSDTAEKKEVNIVYSNWSEGIAVSFLVKNILEEELDYDVNMKIADIEQAYKDLSTGAYDLMLDAWLPQTHQPYFKKHSLNLTDAGIIYKDASLGLVVPQEAAIENISELNSYSEVIFGIDPGAGVMLKTERAIAEYDLQANLISLDEQQMLQVLDSLYKRREPVVVTGWKPHAIFSKYKLKFLQDPKGVFPESDNIHAVVNNKIAERDQVLLDFLKRFSLTHKQFTDLIREVRTHPEGEDTGAKNWMKENTAVVAPWVRNLRKFKEKPL